MTTHAERRHTEWTETYSDYTNARLERRIVALNKRAETKLSQARAAKARRQSRRGTAGRIQDSREQLARAAAQELSAERAYVERLLASRTAGQEPQEAEVSES